MNQLTIVHFVEENLIKKYDRLSRNTKGISWKRKL